MCSVLVLVAGVARAEGGKVVIRDGDKPADVLKRFRKNIEARHGHFHKDKKGAEHLLMAERTMRSVWRDLRVPTRDLTVSIEYFLDKKSVGLSKGNSVRQAIYVHIPNSKDGKLRMTVALVVESLGEEMWHYVQGRTVGKFWFKHFCQSMTNRYKGNAYEREAKIMGAYIQKALWTHDVLTIPESERKVRVFKAMLAALARIKKDKVWKTYPTRLSVQEARLKQLLVLYNAAATPPSPVRPPATPPSARPPKPPAIKLPAKFSWRALARLYPKQLPGLKQTSVNGNEAGGRVTANAHYKHSKVGKAFTEKVFKRVVFSIADDPRSAKYIANMVAMLMKMKGRLPPGKMKPTYINGHPALELINRRKKKCQIQLSVAGRLSVMAVGHKGVGMGKLRAAVESLAWRKLGAAGEKPAGKPDKKALARHPWGAWKVGTTIKFKFVSRSGTTISGERFEKLRSVSAKKLVRTVRLHLRGQKPEYDEWEELPRFVRNETVKVGGKPFKCAVYTWKGGRQQQVATRTVWFHKNRILKTRLQIGGTDHVCPAVALDVPVKVGKATYRCSRLECSVATMKKIYWVSTSVPGALVKTTTTGVRVSSSMTLLGVTGKRR